MFFFIVGEKKKEEPTTVVTPLVPLTSTLNHGIVLLLSAPSSLSLSFSPFLFLYLLSIILMYVFSDMM